MRRAYKHCLAHVFMFLKQPCVEHALLRRAQALVIITPHVQYARMCIGVPRRSYPMRAIVITHRERVQCLHRKYAQNKHHRTKERIDVFACGVCHMWRLASFVTRLKSQSREPCGCADTTKPATRKAPLGNLYHSFPRQRDERPDDGFSMFVATFAPYRALAVHGLGTLRISRRIIFSCALSIACFSGIVQFHHVDSMQHTLHKRRAYES